MSVILVCDHCSKSLKAPESVLGNQVRCPACKGVFLAQATATAKQPAPVEPTLTEEEPKQAHGQMSATADGPSTAEAAVDENRLDISPAPKKGKAKKMTLDENDHAGEQNKPLQKKTIKPSSQLILRVMILLCGLFGGASAAALGSIWQAEQEKYKDIVEAISSAASASNSSDKIREANELLQAQKTVYPLLFVAAGLGLIGGVLGFARFPWLAAPVLLLAAAPAAFYFYKTLLFSAALPFGFVLCLFLRTERQAHRDAERRTLGELRPSPLIGTLGAFASVVCLLVLLGYYTFVAMAISKIEEKNQNLRDLAENVLNPKNPNPPDNIFGARNSTELEQPAKEVPLAQIQQELDAAGAGVKMTKLDLSPAGLDFNIDVPEGTQVKKGVLGEIEITKDAHFSMNIYLGKRRFAIVRKSLVAGSPVTVVVNTPDVVLYKYNWGNGAFTFEMTKSVGYQDISVGNNHDVNGESVEHSKVDCLLMMKCFRTLAPKTPLPTDPAQALERFKAKSNQDQEAPDELALNNKTTDATLALLTGVPKVRVLKIGEATELTRDGLIHLKNLPNLEELNCHGSNITFDAKAIQVLAQLPKLTDLDLSFAKVNADAFPHFKKLTRLETLCLYGESIDDSICPHLKGLTKLKFLSFNITKISGPGLVQFKDLPNLKVLVLNEASINDTGIQNIQGLTQLEELQLYKANITGEGVAALEKLTHLKVLLLSNTKLTDVGMQHLSGLVELEALYVGGTMITDQGLAHLKNMKNLKTLDLTHTNVTVDGLKQLDKLEKLEEIKSDNIKISRFPKRSEP